MIYHLKNNYYNKITIKIKNLVFYYFYLTSLYQLLLNDKYFLCKQKIHQFKLFDEINNKYMNIKGVTMKSLKINMKQINLNKRIQFYSYMGKEYIFMNISIYKPNFKF